MLECRRGRIMSWRLPSNYDIRNALATTWWLCRFPALPAKGYAEPGLQEEGDRIPATVTEIRGFGTESANLRPKRNSKRS